MRLKKGLLDHIEDLGVDKESGQKNIVVRSASEYASLPEAQQKASWTTIHIASEIVGTTPQGIYYRIYHKGLPTKTFKRDVKELKGLTLVKPYGWETSSGVVKRRATDDAYTQMGRSLKKSLGNFSWVTREHQKQIVVWLKAKIRALEIRQGGKGIHEATY